MKNENLESAKNWRTPCK